MTGSKLRLDQGGGRRDHRLADRLRPGELAAELEARPDFESFFAKAPRPTPRRAARGAITGVVCGVRVKAIEEPLVREIRYLDKLVDELAEGEAEWRRFCGRGN